PVRNAPTTTHVSSHGAWKPRFSSNKSQGASREKYIHFNVSSQVAARVFLRIRQQKTYHALGTTSQVYTDFCVRSPSACAFTLYRKKQNTHKRKRTPTRKRTHTRFASVAS
ncbi:unnamed protein product, partial [Ectocarpus sp. 4 AP-2014]